MIRCDDIFVDSDVDQFKKICQIVRLHGFDHLIGITLLGKGTRLWEGESKKRWKLPTKLGLFTNYRIKKICGEKYIGDNTRLIRALDTEFNKYEAIPALHGLHHYKYVSLPKKKVLRELSTGMKLFEELFNMRCAVFTPPFGAWNSKTELVCRSLSLSIDKCRTVFDKLIEVMNDSQIKQLAKLQSSMPEVMYHPFRLTDLNKFELYLKIRRKYC